MARDKFQQAMLIGIGVMVAIGFSGVFVYGPMTNSGSGNQGEGGQDVNASLPDTHFSEESFGLTIQEQAYLSANNEVVFVNALYENSSEVYSDLETLPEEMNDRVYVNLVNNSESSIASDYDLEIPSAFIIGDQPSETREGTAPYSMSSSEPGKESIKQAVCEAMREPGDLAASCFS